MNKIIWFALAVCTGAPVLFGQGPDIRIVLNQGERPHMAVPDLRGSGAAQPLMGTFNQTLWSDLDSAGLFSMVPKTSYPTMVPQQPSDFRQAPTPEETARTRKRREPAAPTSGGGLWMSDWSSPPVSANYLAIGYTAVQNDVLVLYGWLLDLSRGTPSNAQVFGNRYLGSVDQAGARKVAHEFAADILKIFGQPSLFGTKIIFVSDRTRNKEVWMMDWDGSNQRQVTQFKSLTIMPAVSPDG